MLLAITRKASHCWGLQACRLNCHLKRCCFCCPFPGKFGMRGKEESSDTKSHQSKLCLQKSRRKLVPGAWQELNVWEIYGRENRAWLNFISLFFGLGHLFWSHSTILIQEQQNSRRFLKKKFSKAISASSAVALTCYGADHAVCHGRLASSHIANLPILTCLGSNT